MLAVVLTHKSLYRLHWGLFRDSCVELESPLRKTTKETLPLGLVVRPDVALGYAPAIILCITPKLAD